MSRSMSMAAHGRTPPSRVENVTENHTPDLARLPQFLVRLEQRDPGRPSLARQLLDAGWLVDDFWGPVQMDVWRLALRRGDRAAVFGIERGAVDEVRIGPVGGAEDEFTPLSFAVLGWARSCGAPVPLDDPDAFRPDAVAHGLAALDWLEEGNDAVLARIQAAWEEYGRRRWSLDQRLGPAWLAETKERGIREIEAAAAPTGHESRTERLE